MFEVMSTTRQILGKILRENTGQVLVDSGGYNGRDYQKRRTIKSFSAIPEQWAFEYLGDKFLKKNAFLFLAEHLTYDPEMTRKLLRTVENPYDSCQILEFIESIEDRTLDINWSSVLENSILDVTIEFDPFEHDGDEYIILQVHGGCDIRWGYTKPRAFKVQELGPFLSGITSISASCECGVCDLYDGEFEIENFTDDDIGSDGLPTRWKVIGRAIWCDTCKNRVLG